MNACYAYGNWELVFNTTGLLISTIVFMVNYYYGQWLKIFECEICRSLKPLNVPDVWI